VKDEAPQGRFSDTLHVDPSGLVTLTTPNRMATVGVCAIPLPQGRRGPTKIRLPVGAVQLGGPVVWVDTVTLTCDVTSSHWPGCELITLTPGGTIEGPFKEQIGSRVVSLQDADG